jgi:hypothetical protein
MSVGGQGLFCGNFGGNGVATPGTWTGIVVERRYATRGFFSQFLAVLDMAAGIEIL